MQRYPSLFLSVTIIVCSATFARGADYSIVPINVGSDRFPASVMGINNSGQITGYAIDSHDFANVSMYGFIYFNNATTDIIAIENQYVCVVGINDSGVVVGWSGASSGDWSTFLYSQESGMIDLSSVVSRCYGINAAGQVTGSFTLEDQFTSHAFLYSDGSIKDLGALGGFFSAGKAINASGQVVGYSSLADDSTVHAFLYSNGVMTDLGTLGGPDSDANAINDAGQITGCADLADGSSHAFLYDNNAMIDLGTLGGDYSIGLAINNLGQVVGWAETIFEGDRHAFLYTNGRMIDLNTLIDPASGWVLLNATGINDAGQIIGHGTFHGIPHAFLLTPITAVPEPATLPVLALATFALARRRA